MLKKKSLFILIFIIILAVGLIIFMNYREKPESSQGVSHPEPSIDYYTCGMHPSVKIAPEDYTDDTLCPICNMKLVPVYKDAEGKEKVYYGCGLDSEGKCSHCDLGEPDGRCICGQHSFVIEGEEINCPVCGKSLKELSAEEVDKLKGVASRVKIKGEQIRLAGVRSEPIEKRHLYKEIRTVGKVAYDPGLAIAQEEFISALNAWDKIKEGDIPEIKERSQNLVESSKRKLRLLGLSEDQIKELEENRKIHTSLILPEKKMWVYGDAYEYELGWIKQGAQVKVTASSFPEKEFTGVISSVNPVVDSRTRSVRFRAEVDNSDLELKPEMYVDVVIQSMYLSPEGEHMVLAVPKDAVLDTGTRKIVWVDKGNGEFEGRIVELGPEANAAIGDSQAKFYPVLKGLSEGDSVVTKANFLIDSQSQITGVAAAAYGGALEAGEETPQAMPPGHQH